MDAINNARRDFFGNSTDDELCAMASAQTESRLSIEAITQQFNATQNAEDEICLMAVAQTERNDVGMTINRIMRENPAAKYYSENMFYKFELWPKYLRDLFVTHSIQNYTYSMRNKICIFFWGNGGTYEIMSTLSEYFAPRLSTNTYKERREYTSSHYKCQQLFKTYSEQLHNPNYYERYYYYNIHQGRMLYMDNVPRCYGQRQPRNPQLPSWY